MSKIELAVIQMCSSENVEANLIHAEHWIRSAARKGAELILTPEMTTIITQSASLLLKEADPVIVEQRLAFFQNLAKELKVMIHLGSLPVFAEKGKCFNRSYLINRDGNIVSHYDKIHLFDMQWDEGKGFQESASYKAGSTAVVSQCQFSGSTALLGMSICYDLRFPNLYSDLALAGAQIIAVPAAFTDVTGEAHWHVLLRARAIENGAYIVAAAQGGVHEAGRQTFGHALIVDPWGEIIAEVEDDQAGFAIATICLNKVAYTRNKIANLQHRRPYHMLKKE